MTFLKESVRVKKNFGGEPSIIEEEEEEEEDVASEHDSISSSTSTSSDAEVASKSNDQHQGSNTLHICTKEIEWNIKLQDFKRADVTFLCHVLERMDKMSPKQKATTQAKIEQVLLEVEFSDQPPMSVPQQQSFSGPSMLRPQQQPTYNSQQQPMSPYQQQPMFNPRSPLVTQQQLWRPTQQTWFNPATFRPQPTSTFNIQRPPMLFPEQNTPQQPFYQQQQPTHQSMPGSQQPISLPQQSISLPQQSISLPQQSSSNIQVDL